MRLTKKLMKENHTELWLWCHEDPTRQKHEWPRWESNGGDIPDIFAHCFPCEYKAQHFKMGQSGCHCPLDFPGWGESRSCLGGLFIKWEFATGKARSALAKQIAELPIRKRR